MSGPDSTKTLIQGTAILAFAALFTKIIGVIYKIPYQNITGDDGLYVYSMVYPIYMILLTVATAGIPIAVSKLVSERLTLGDRRGARRIFQVSAMTLTATGILMFFILFFGAPLVVTYLFFSNDQDLTLPIRSVSFALLVVPVMASIRGYFQGHQIMLPTGISQVVEQIVRVTTILLGAYFLFDPFGHYYAGAAAVFGAFTGAAVAMITLLFFWKKVTSYEQDTLGQEDNERSSGHPQTRSYEDEPYRRIMRKVFAYAIPISLGSLVIPLFQLVDSSTIPRLLIWSGWEQGIASTARGIFDRGQPLVQFGAFFATALALALVPSISEAHVKQDHGLIARRTNLAIKLTFVVGLASALGLSVLSDAVNGMLYVNQSGPVEAFIPDFGSQAISVLAFVIIFSTLGITSAAILQGLGHVMLPARNLFIGVIVKAIGNVLFVPLFDISGAALASVVGYMVATSLNLLSIYRLTGIGFSTSFLYRPVLAVAVMVGAVWLTKQGIHLALPDVYAHSRLYFTIVSLASVFTGMSVYGMALLKFRAVSRRELLAVPKVKRLVPIFEKLRLIESDGQPPDRQA